MGVTVYLAGPINGQSDEEAKGWRALAAESLEAAGYLVLDPMARDYRGVEDQNVDDIVEGDKADILDSEIVLAYCPRPSVGTSMELFFAWHNSIPSVVVVPDGPVSPWLRYHATLVFTSLSDAIEQLVNRARRA